LKNSAGAASLQVLDDLTENPELIWTAEMQSELRDALTKIFSDNNNDYSSPPELDVNYHVPFQQLESELYVGGVYIRLYLKQPTFRLSNPVLFTEKLIEFWESAFNIQVPPQKVASGGMAMASDDADGDGAISTAVVLGSEDFLSLLTSSIVCVVKGESSVIDHLLAWGFVSGLCDLLKRAMEAKRKGVPAMSIVRLMHQFVSRVDCVDSIANTDFIRQVVVALGGTGTPRNASASTNDKVELPKEAGFIVELLKRVYQCRGSSFIGVLVHNATQADLPNFLLDCIIGASQEDLANVLHPAALRIHAVDTIKAIIAADEFQAGPLQALLDVHPVWSEYKDQSHDLFITDQEKTDPFLIQDSTDKAVMGLLTDGSVKSGISTHFTSTGPPPPVAKDQDVVIERPTAPTGNSPPPAVPVMRRNSGNASKSPLVATHPPAGPANASSTNAGGVNAAATASGVGAGGVHANRFVVTINKGTDGLGLDIGKIASGGCMIRRLKEIPGGRPNPAAACVPALKAGDMIVGVNEQEIEEFGAVVAVIKGLPAVATVTLLIERGTETM
jgi:DnaJ family protein C protein 13